MKRKGRGQAVDEAVEGAVHRAAAVPVEARQVAEELRADVGVAEHCEESDMLKRVSCLRRKVCKNSNKITTGEGTDVRRNSSSFNPAWKARWLERLNLHAV